MNADARSNSWPSVETVMEQIADAFVKDENLQDDAFHPLGGYSRANQDWQREISDQPLFKSHNRDSDIKAFQDWWNVSVQKGPEWIKEHGGDPSKTISENLENPSGKLSLEIVVHGLQYIALSFQPGSEDFRGAWIKSSLVDADHAGNVRRSLRVPRRMGAVNWMKHLFDERKKTEQPDWHHPSVVAIFDAWFDLRGRAATEDLILGNRSVAGFPVYLFGSKELAGFFFVSHPIPGLFYEEADSPAQPYEARGSVLKAMQAISNQYGTSLASAIDMDMLAGFARNSRPSALGSKSKDSQLIDLSIEDPTGYLATLLFKSSSGSVACDVNEGYFVQQLWALLGLLSFLPWSWQIPLVRRMQEMASDIERDPKAVVCRWELQNRGLPLHDEAAATYLYYPEPGLARLACPISDKDDFRETPLSRRIGASMDLYSIGANRTNENFHQLDLVVPLLASSRQGSPQAQVIAILRFNCEFSSGQFKAAHDLYTLVSSRKALLDEYLGGLLRLADQDIRTIVNGKLGPDLYKQAEDTVRMLTGWCTQRLTQPASQEKERAAQEFLMEAAFQSVWKKLGLAKEETEYRDGLLREAQHAISTLSRELQGGLSEAVTLVSFWLRMWSPKIEEIVAAESEQDLFTALVMEDPGLPTVLGHLVCTKEWKESIEGTFPLHGGMEYRRTVRKDRIEFGFPSSDARLSQLNAKKNQQGDMEVFWTKDADDATSQSVVLHWNDDASSCDLCSFLPASISAFPGKVSKRVADGILALGPASLDLHQAEVQDKRSIEPHVRSDSESLRQSIRRLEIAFADRLLAGGDSQLWTVLPLRRSDQDSDASMYLCILAAGGSERSIVKASRDLTLSNAVARYRAGCLAKEQASRIIRAAQYHGFIGPAKQLFSAVRRTMNGLDARLPADEDHNQSLSRIRKEAQERLEKIKNKILCLEILAGDAVYFSNGERLEKKELNPTLTDLHNDIAYVIQANNEPLESRIVYEPVEALSGLHHFSYDRSIFRHGLARFIENAVKHTDSQEISDKQIVVLTHFQEGKVLLAISNATRSAEHATECALKAQNSTTTNHGVFEARLCFEELKYEWGFRSDGNRFISEVWLPVLEPERRLV